MASSLTTALSAIGTGVSAQSSTSKTKLTDIINTFLPVYQTYAQVQALKAGNLPLTGLSSLSQVTGVDALQTTWESVKKYWPIGIGVLLLFFLMVKK